MNLEINPNKVYVIAKKEYMDNVRSKWILLLTVLFAVLTMVFSYFGSVMTGGDVGFQSFEVTVLGMVTITSILLPIVAIMLGYGAVVSERENGSMSVVLGCQVSRSDVIIGKFLGLGAVMFTTIFVGMGLSGIIIAALATGAKWGAYLAFMLGTWIFTMVYLGFSIFLSTITDKRTTAMGGGVFLWFSGMILNLVLIGIWSATGGDFGSLLSGEMSFPDWYWAGEFFSFMDIYQMGSMLLFDLSEVMGYSLTAPSWVNITSIFGWLTFMSALPFVLSLIFLQRRDI